MVFIPKRLDEKPVGECAYCHSEIYSDFYASGHTMVCCIEHRDAYIAEHPEVVDIDDFTFFYEYEQPWEACYEEA